VLTPAQTSQVQYAMEDTTVNGTAVNAANGLGGRPIIAKTGTTDNAQSAFFIGAIPQYALTVGIFTENQSDKTKETLNGLGGDVGGGFGGYWPARIWNTFAENEWASTPVQQFQTPIFTGQTWNMFGADGVPAPTPAPTKSATQPAAQPSAPAQPSQPGFQPSTQPSANPQPSTGNIGGGSGGGGGGGGNNGQPPNNGAALAGAAVLLPVGPLWRSRRRKRKRR